MSKIETTPGTRTQVSLVCQQTTSVAGGKCKCYQPALMKKINNISSQTNSGLCTDSAENNMGIDDKRWVYMIGKLLLTLGSL